ncbi:MAG: tetratricopeptide repeat protein [Treponema sp.]|nr:tetratricopeptide repeat protein [Treponema sp.]
MSTVNEKNLILTRAKSAVLSRDFATAARLYKTLLRDDPSNVDYLKELGAIYVKNGEDAKAIPYYEQIITFYPHYVEAMNSLGAIYRRLKRYEDSIQILERALDEDRQTGSVNYNLGFTYKEMGNYDDAIEAFEIVVSEDPSDVLAYNHLGKIYFDKKEYQKSINSYKHGLAVDKNHPILNYNLALCYTEAKMYTDAIRCYETALKAKPGWVEAIRDFSKLLIDCQKTKEASDLVHRSIDLHPDDSKLLCILGRIYIDQYDYDSAISTFQKAEEVDNTDIQILTGLAEALEKGEKPQEALDAVVKAMEIDPENRDIKKQFVHTLLSAEEYDAAQVNVQELYEDNGQNDLQVLDLYSQYYICTEDEENLKKTQEKIVKLNKHYKNYLINAAERYSQIGQNEQAEHYAKQFVAREIRNPAGYNMLGKIYTRLGSIQEAIDSFDKSRNLKKPNILADKQIKRLQKQLPVITEQPAENPVEEESAPVVEPEKVIEEEQTETPDEEEFDYSQMGDSIPMEKSLLEEEEPFFDDLDNIAEAMEDDVDSEPENEAQNNSQNEDSTPLMMTSDDNSGGAMQNPYEESQNQQGVYSGMPSMEYGNEPLVQPMPSYTPQSEMNGMGGGQTSANAMETALNAQRLAQELADEQSELKNRIKNMEEQQNASQEAIEAQAKKLAEAIENQKYMSDEDSLDSEKLFSDSVDFGEGAVLSDAETESLIGAPEEKDSMQDFDDDFYTPVDNPAEFSDFAELEDVVEGDDFMSDNLLPGGLVSAADAELAEIERQKTMLVMEDFNFWNVDEILEMIQLQNDENSGIEVLEEVDYIEEDFTEVEEKEKSIEGGQTPENLLPTIQKILADENIAEENADKIELFKKLLALSSFLPENEKESFLAGKPRMQIEYLISKMSGRPGLLQTSQSLRKSGTIDAVENNLDEETDLSNESLRKVIKLMKKLTADLDDKYLAKALCCSADSILEQIELQDQKSQIF